tara:strand:+ start:47 stop:268 length:222 start_codon:yes stop_codon:yes gene_type:complete
VGREVIQQETVLSHHAAQAVVEPVIMFKHVLMLGAVVFVAVISMINVHVRIGENLPVALLVIAINVVIDGILQ